MKTFLATIKATGNPVRILLGSKEIDATVEALSDDRVTFKTAGGMRYTTHPDTVVIEHS